MAFGSVTKSRMTSYFTSPNLQLLHLKKQSKAKQNKTKTKLGTGGSHQ
jgi:hypothetical protein